MYLYMKIQTYLNGGSEALNVFLRNGCYPLKYVPICGFWLASLSSASNSTLRELSIKAGAAPFVGFAFDLIFLVTVDRVDFS